MKLSINNKLLYLITNNNLLFSKKNSQILYKKKYLILLNFLKKNNYIHYIKKDNMQLSIYLKTFENLSLIKNIKIYNHYKIKKLLTAKEIYNLKKKNNYTFYIFYNNLGFLNIDEVLRINQGAFLIAKIY